MKAKRIYIYQCEKGQPENPWGNGETDGYFVVALDGKGPDPYKERHQCPVEGCGGYGKFVGVYVPEGTPPPHPVKAGKRKKKPSS